MTWIARKGLSRLATRAGSRMSFAACRYQGERKRSGACSPLGAVVPRFWWWSSWNCSPGWW